ncbi:hypothetical protein BRLA_c042640 [Brevibacillus laterosporus LMG 15441]|uniref:Uncharacterized protein n=1 Tax=Brevibacillus laterosporus LMG 15441 TaxID=1042163 RepID=A0A075R9H8_BRELA|nr:hypothetical protein BRLA_c042640 [Brevibacillus laterosporus LMG 15441]
MIKKPEDETGNFCSYLVSCSVQFSVSFCLKADHHAKSPGESLRDRLNKNSWLFSLLLVVGNFIRFTFTFEFPQVIFTISVIDCSINVSIFKLIPDVIADIFDEFFDF